MRVPCVKAPKYCLGARAKLPHVPLSLFAIDMGEENSYTPTAPEGVMFAIRVFEN